MGVLLPEVEIPEVIGEVIWQEVAFEEDQEYVYVSPVFKFTGPSEPLAFMSAVTTAGMAGKETTALAVAVPPKPSASSQTTVKVILPPTVG